MSWYSHEPTDGTSLDRPGIYEWRLSGIGIYVGKSVRLPARIREYPNNVRKMIAGAPYRRNKPANYRDIHHHLRQAHDTAAAVTVAILENCNSSELNQRERYWIERRRQEQAIGGPRVLNAS